MQEFINTLSKEFQLNSNANIAAGQAQYMRNQFAFFGLSAPERKQIQQAFLVNKYLPPKSQMSEIVKQLWQKEQREFQYFAQEFALKYSNRVEQQDIELFAYMISHKSWWDTVDFIATKLVGNYFKQFPEQRDYYVQKWLDSQNIWLQRSAVLFQLKYKNDLDTELLTLIIKSLQPSNEFFINKAIGWILREYSRSNPAWVQDFVAQNQLSKLSAREALRLL
jgi:3-methyladenine DNA glycosylase AlkD